MRMTIAIAVALLLLAPGQSEARGRAERASESAVDPDALCLVIVRGSALASKRASADTMRDIETAFAYFAGRVSARNEAGAITPKVAAALKWNPPKHEYDLKGLTCMAYGMSGAGGSPADRDAPSAGQAAAGAADPDVGCALLMHAAKADPASVHAPPARQRGLAIAAAYYAGRVTGRHGASAYKGLLAEAASAPQAAGQSQSSGDECFRGGSRGIHAVNLEIDAALPKRRG